MTSAGSPALRLRELAAAAMIGTDRSGSGSPEKLLTEASVVGARMRSGWKPRASEGALPACPAESRAPASAAAQATLFRLIGDPDAGLIEEWAMLAQGRGVRVADAAVPALMDWWSRQPKRSEVVYAVLGQRGEWLASLNPAWRKPVAGSQIPADADDIWQTGKAPERQAILVTIRRHDPARALALVQSTWQTDGADERRRFVEALLEGRSMADEPFLEAALDDKSKVVRRAAAGVLARVPGSRLRARMNERARAIIVVEAARKGILRKGAVKLSLNPPHEFEKEWERDGIEEQAAAGTGKRAWWMRQILSAADLSVWTEATGLDPEGVIAAIGEDDYAAQALGALRDAASGSGDAGWSLAVARGLMNKMVSECPRMDKLLQGLEPKDREELLLEVAAHDRLALAERWSLFASSEHMWSKQFSMRALKLLMKHAPKRADEAWGLYPHVDSISYLVAPGAEVEFVETVGAMFPDAPSESFKRSIDRVRLRADMHKEFST